MQMNSLESRMAASQARPASPRDSALVKNITFATGASELGRVLVARTDAGVCAILIGADDVALEADLEARFPGRVGEPDDARAGGDLAKVLRMIATPREGLDLTLDMQGTPFQRRVWTTLREIPAGETVTYTELAARLGEPQAVRAVAGACAANVIALAVPCHRVVRRDGSLADYRWGVDRKRALIAKEDMA
jgi:AraC family transcriptional regulator of adaptative response/methylated-DNA-[protein]-cysteine methyltransferase